MFKSIAFLVLLLPVVLKADSFELMAGSLTYHTLVDHSVTDYFPHKISNDGNLIYNQLYGIGYINNQDLVYQSFRVFAGNNSIEEPMVGGAYSFGFSLKNWDNGLVIGGYFQDGASFSKKINYLWALSDFIPLVGFEFNYKIMLSDKIFIKINNYLSPIITNHSLSIGQNF